MYKTQFDRFLLDLYQEYRLDRISMDLEAIQFRIQYMMKHRRDYNQIPALQKQYNQKVLETRKIFGEFLHEFLIRIVTIEPPHHLENIVDILAQDVKIDPVHVSFTMLLYSDSEAYLQYVDQKIPEGQTYNMFPNEFFRFYSDSYNDGIAKAYPELFEQRHQDQVGTGDDADVFVHSFTFQTTERCNLSCTYCFGGETPILMDGLSQKPIKDVMVGDLVIGIPESLKNENHEYYDQNNYQAYPVTHVFKRRANCIKVIWVDLDDEMYITPDHPVILSDGKCVPFIDWWHDEECCSAPIFVGDGDLYLSNINQWEVRVDETPVEMDVYNLETESHTFVAWNMLVHNCYQMNKSPMRMQFEDAKTFIDKLLRDEYGYINRYNSPAIIIEFIGGEPLLEIALTRKIYEYFLDQCYELNHPWFHMHRLSICSNGMLYFHPEVQEFFQEYHQNISFNISIDGNKELHDACRIQENGEGTYDIDMMALDHYTKHYTPERNSKMTLAPSNIRYLYDSVVDFIKKGMRIINLNCVFEEGWTPETAKEEYYQLKKLADYLIDHDLEHLYVAIFNERQEDVQDKHQDASFCLDPATQIATPNGSIAVENLEVGQLVYTASGNIHRVTRRNRRVADKLLIMSVSGALPIICTPDHKFYARIQQGKQRYRRDFVEASKISMNDWIALPTIDISQNTNENIGHKIAFLLGVFMARGRITEEHQHYIPGYYDPDGTIQQRLIEAGLKVTDVRIHRSDDPYLSIIHCNENDAFLKICDQMGKLKAERHIPGDIWKLEQSRLRAFLDGVLHCYQLRSKDKKYIDIESSSLSMMHDVLILLRAFGYLPHVTIRPSIGTVSNSFNYFRFDRYRIRILTGEMTQRWCMNYYDRDNVNPNILWGKVQYMIYKPDGKYTVYCPTVEPICPGVPSEHTILVHGLASHQCGGAGQMLAMRPNGQFYPCIRYMPSSVGDQVPDLCIGDIEHGIIGRSEGSPVLQMLDRITRRSQTNDICFDCPISNDCPSCLALGHTVYGTPNKRASFICIQMIAEALANVYYWNRLLLKHPEYDLDVRKNNVPDEWALLVIDQDELEELKLLESAAMMVTLERRFEAKEQT